jgi:DNA replication licensing factor MCM3
LNRLRLVQIAQHVLGQHRYRPAGDDGKSVRDDTAIDCLEDDEERRRGETAVRVKYDARLYGPRRPGQKEPLSIAFLKKYVAFAKQRFAAPELTSEATEAIAEYYAELRNSAEVKALPVTVRSLETIIRLSCAHAKVRLSAYVEAVDVEEVQVLVDTIMKSDPSAQETRKARREDGRTKRARGEGGGEEEEEEAEAEAGSDEEGAGAGEDEAINNAEADVEMASPGAGAGWSRGAAGASLREAIAGVVQELGHANSTAASVTGIAAVLKARAVAAPREEIVRVLQELHDAEKIVLEGEEFFLAS